MDYDQRLKDLEELIKKLQQDLQDIVGSFYTYRYTKAESIDFALNVVLMGFGYASRPPSVQQIPLTTWNLIVDQALPLAQKNYTTLA